MIVVVVADEDERDGWEVAIVSGDLDMLQLVGPKVSLLHTARGGADNIVTYDAARIHERYGLTPEQMVDFKSLKGDSSDNIPGIPGVGEKTASKLIAHFGSLEQLYARLDEVEPVRIRELLRDHRDAAFAGQGLMTIDCNAPLEIPAKGGVIGEYDRDAALAAAGIAAWLANPRGMQYPGSGAANPAIQSIAVMPLARRASVRVRSAARCR